MIHVGKLKGKMKELDLTQRDLSKYCKLDISSINRKINDETGKSMRSSEAHLLKKCLELTDEEFSAIFAADKPGA